MPDNTPSVGTLQGLAAAGIAAVALREVGGALLMDLRQGTVSANTAGRLGRSAPVRWC